jgi:hypothetical protein
MGFFYVDFVPKLISFGACLSRKSLFYVDFCLCLGLQRLRGII